MAQQQPAKRGNRARKLIGLLLVLLVAYVLLATRTTAPSGGGSGTTTGVQWGDYAPGLQGRIDGLASSKDCASLQTEFNNADANNNATMRRTGHNNAELMGYIDDKMRAAGCY